MIQGLSAIPYMGAVALGKAVGVTTAGLSAMEISNAVTQKIKDNPELLNDPRFKAAALTFGINVPGYIAPDADEIEKIRKEIQEGIKPAETSSPIDQGPIVLGGSEPPKIETTEKFPAAEEVGPIKEQFPSEADKVNIPIITYSKDSPKDLKDLVDRSVGQEKGEKAIEKLYDDSIFDDVLETSELNRIRQLEDSYVGGLNDLGDASVPLIIQNNLLDQHKEYMDDYKDALAKAAQETLGSEFKAYRLMEKDDALKMLIDGEFPNVKTVQENEEGEDVYQDLIIDLFGRKTPMSREFFSFTLSPKEALQFRFLSAGGRRDKKDEDFVLIEMNAAPSDIVMRGHESEKDLILKVDGENAGSIDVTPNIFNVYDMNFGDSNQVELSENKEFKNFVEQSKQEVEQDKQAKQIPKVLKLKEIDDDDNPDLDTPEAFNEEGKIVDSDKLVKMEKFNIPFVKRVETERQDAFPFSIKDFKGGALDNKTIKEAFDYVQGDAPEDNPQPFSRDKFLLTPPRGQQEIALRLIKQKLIEDNANPLIIKHITNLQNELNNRIKETGYYGHGTKLEENLDVGFGLFNLLKRKKNAKGGMIDKPLPGGSKDI